VIFETCLLAYSDVVTSSWKYFMVAFRKRTSKTACSFSHVSPTVHYYHCYFPSYIKLKFCVWVCVFAYSSRTDKPICTKLGSFLETRKIFQKGQNSERLSSVRVPMKVVSIAWKLSTIEEQRKEHNCLCRRADYKDWGQNPKTVLGSSLGKDVGFTDNNNFLLWFSKIRIECSGLW
jgi:hypothetical protein